MNRLKRFFLLVLILITSKIVLAQTFSGKLKVSVSNCLTPQIFRLYSLEKEQLLLDETKVSGANGKEEFLLNLDKLTNWEEPRYLLSISPLGMDIDIVVSKDDSDIEMHFALPTQAGSEEIYTTLIEFKGSKKAQEFYDMNVNFWGKSIAIGKKRQTLLATNSKKADSVQVTAFNSDIEEAIQIIDSSDNLNCVNFCFYRIIEKMKTVKIYFNVELYNKKELQGKLKNFRNKYPQSPMMQMFLDDLKPIIEGVQW